MVTASGNKRIAGAGFTEQIEMVLFKDGVLEIMVPAKKKIFSTKIKPQSVAEILLDPNGKFALISASGDLEVISLDGVLNEP